MNSIIDKKGMTMGFLVAMIITLVAFVLISGTLFRFMSGAEDKQAELLCKDSVALRQFSTVKINDNEVKVAPVLCKTIDKKIKPKGTNLEEEKSSVMTQFADNMARCWWMFGEGRYEKNLFDSVSVFGGKNKCFQCYSLLIEEGKEFAQGSTITPVEFNEFLRTKKYGRSNTTYIDYFKRNGMILSLWQKDQFGKNIGITPNHGYAVAYKARANECSWCGYLVGGGTAGVAIGAAAVALAIPTGGASLGVAAAATIAGGSVVAGAGLATGGYGAVKIIDDKFFSEVRIDTIYTVDMQHDTLNQLFSQKCESVHEGVGGR